MYIHINTYEGNKVREENLEKLDIFLETIDKETRTTRRASEIYYNSPEIDPAIEGERLIKATLDSTYADFNNNVIDKSQGLVLTNIKELYWNDASKVTELYGATSAKSLDDYFHVSLDRHEGAIRGLVRESYSPETPPRYLLNSIEMYAEGLNVDIMTAARIATTHLKMQLPAMKKRADELMLDGFTEVSASTRVFGEFCESLTPSHINDVQENAASDSRMQYNKPSFYPRVSMNETKSPPLRLRRADAKGLMSLYRLERRPYNEEELLLGEDIIQNPRLQVSLLLFQLAVVDYSREYLEEHPERMRHSLLPFSEFFVVGDNETEGQFLPNPKLIKVLSNNLVPAIASTLIRDDNPIESLTSDQLVVSAIDARKRRVFQAQIGKFNNYDPVTDTVELDTFFNRTCPAMQMLTASLTNWLPHIYKTIA